ncbi:ATP-binding protein, partial [Streptomyces sp. NPDC059447]|uniref:ATP-binding protein n=1 Tax=Streptomyces sp. NPDC059447 TaxID=3346834 RepID=UPI0036CBB086
MAVADAGARVGNRDQELTMPPTHPHPSAAPTSGPTPYAPTESTDPYPANAVDVRADPAPEDPCAPGAPGSVGRPTSDALARTGMASGPSGTTAGLPHDRSASAPTTGGSSGAAWSAGAASDGAAQAAGLIGRDHELRVLEGALRDPGTRMVTLVGPAGVGKSVLAATVASTLTPGPAGTPGTPVFDALRSTAPGADAMPAAGRTLLLLDGCDHARRRSPEAMAALLATHPGVTVLATALEPLGLYGERTVQVAPLPVPLPHEVETGDPTELGRVPAVVLFVLRATRSCPGFALTEENAEAVGRLCALLEGLPAALELAAGRMRLYSPAALLARLTRSPGALSGGPASAPERHRSLAALAEFGLEGLTADERELVERLSVHEGGFGALGVPRSAEDALDRLLERGVLRLAHPDGARPAEPRYAVPEPVRSYCLARLADAGDGRREAAADEHADRYARLAATAAPRLVGPERARWFAVLADEADNVRVALERLVARGDRATAAATVLACREPWLAQGRLREGTAWCERMPAEGPPGLPEPVLARLTELAGVLALARGETAEAVHLLRSALDRSKRLGDRRQTAAIGAQWGEALLADGDPHGAVAALEPGAAARGSGGAGGRAAGRMWGGGAGGRAAGRMWGVVGAP